MARIMCYEHISIGSNPIHALSLYSSIGRAYYC